MVAYEETVASDHTVLDEENFFSKIKYYNSIPEGKTAAKYGTPNLDENSKEQDIFCESNADINSMPPLIEQLKKLLFLGAPSSFSALMAYIGQAITLVFIGKRLGTKQLAYYNVGISVFNLFGTSIVEGLVAALNTLVSQSYGRNKQDSAEIGDYLQVSIVVNTLSVALIGLFFSFNSSMLELLFGMDFGSSAQEFILMMLPNLYLNMTLFSFFYVLGGINKTLLPLYAMSPTLIVSATLNYFFMKGDDYTVSVYIITFVTFFQCTSIIIATLIHPDVTFYKNCRYPSKKLLNMELYKEYLRIGIPSLFTTLAEWWAFEVLFIIASHLSTDAVVLTAMSLSVIALFFSIPYGISIAASVCVGNSLGEGNGKLAHRYAYLSLLFQFVVKNITILFLILFRHDIASIYTKDPEIHESFTGIFILVLALFHYVDATQIILSGIFKGAGMQAQLVKVVLCALWLVGLPLAFIFAKVLNWGVEGLLLGMSSGFLIEIPLLAICYFRWDWDAMALKASRAAHKQEIIDETTLLIPTDFKIAGIP